MIKVKIFQKGDFIYGFHIEGHAETAEYGKDIVCASVSGISQSVLLGLKVHLKQDIKWEIDEKNGAMKAELLSNPNSETEAIMQTMLLGLGEISREYPKAIQIFEE